MTLHSWIEVAMLCFIIAATAAMMSITLALLGVLDASYVTGCMQR